MSAPKLSEEQAAAVEMLGVSMAALAQSIQRLDELGLAPAEAFRAIGIEVPAMAAPMLNHLIRSA